MWHKWSVDIRSLFTPDRQRKLGAFAVVLAAHAGLFAMVARTQPTPLQPILPVIEVELFRPLPPPPPPPPPPPVEPARTQGGGAPAAPSRIHVPPDPPERPPELVAPPVPAPEPVLVIGAAPVAGPTPGMGQGGEGTGTGTGQGSGSGPGSGGTRERFLRGPSMAELARVAPAGGPQQTTTVRMRCRIRTDARLADCRVVDESPAGSGYGPAALSSADYFRFQPPMEGGRALEGREVTVGVVFPARGGGARR